MLLKSGVTAAVVALAGLAAPAAHAVDVPMCAATAPAGHTRAYCEFTGLAGTYKVTISSVTVRYAWARVTCTAGPVVMSLFVDAWDTEGGYDEQSGFLPGGNCELEVAAGASTFGGAGHATGVVYYVV